MDSLATAAARALAHGDPLGALRRVALRDDAPSLALRGIAMAQLGDLGRAKELLAQAAYSFGRREGLAAARCQVALEEVRLASRQLEEDPRGLVEAIEMLAAHGDRTNAILGQLVLVRRLVLLGRVDDARQTLADIDLVDVPPHLRTIAALCEAGIHLRSLQSRQVEEHLALATREAARAGIPALQSEVEKAMRTLEAPVARLVSGDEKRVLKLSQVEEVLRSDALVVDGCRRTVRFGGRTIPLERRPVLFALINALAVAWPDDLARNDLIAAAFGVRRSNASHRSRLRVELGRVRKVTSELLAIDATPSGYRLLPLRSASVAVLVPPIDGEAAHLLALLSDGQAWSTSALRLAVGASQRSVQRALASLEGAHAVEAVGRGRAKRWLAPPVEGFATTLLLFQAE